MRNSRLKILHTGFQTMSYWQFEEETFPLQSRMTKESKTIQNRPQQDEF